ncbi:MAG: RHS repeat-associated core domain-containing protein, partial [Dysgonamonadaceae bacterium]|nr:RHS repeat-associated core domain-containing protein [Dysgonamonadaceae bacterium]
QSGTVEQVNHYYPFGGLFGEGLQISNQPYKYNGKELDRFEGLDLFDYGARHYDAALGRWGTVDPLAEKYYSISPYVYCANNPVRFIDPNGEEIWLYQYNDKNKRVEKMQYTPGMEYDGDNIYFANTITTLNQMNSVENGGIVLGELHGSENIFEVTNQSSSTEGTGQFVEKENGGAIIKLGESFTLENIAHEMFHGYQHEMGQGGASIFNEVEAYLFGYTVGQQYFFDNEGPQVSSMIPMGRKNAAGAIYEKSFDNLSKRFSTEDFKKTVINFKGGSEINSQGIYNNNYPIQRQNQRKSLIKRFYPLIQ